jgi:hypothetical protein
MAGNSKPKRKSAGIKNDIGAHPVTPRAMSQLRTINPYREAGLLHKSVMDSLNQLTAQTGTMKDWIKVVVRMYVGAIAFNDYFESNPDVNVVINRANLALEIVMVRVHSTAYAGAEHVQFGFTVAEADSVVDALWLIDEAIRRMTPKEISTAYSDADRWLDIVIANNQQQANLAQRETNKQISALETERELLAANHVDVPLEEAA